MSTSTTSKKPDISVIGASAGTGKTTRLTQEFLEAIRGTDDKHAPIDPANILVCTFTNKAADELSARIREKLIEEGEWLAAQQALTGYLGTVNSICGRILIDYALEAGLSPRQNVIPAEIQKQVFAAACAPVLDDFAEKIDRMAARLSFDEQPKNSGFDRSKYWHDYVNEICDLARNNRISPESLSEHAMRSWAGLKIWLQPILSKESDELNEQLLHHLAKAIADISNSNDTTAATKSGLDKLHEYQRKARFKRLTWADWAGISKVEVAKKADPLLRTLREVAAQHPAHPQLHEDLECFTSLVFQCAADALTAYQQYKKEAGLVDFTDQEYQTLTLMDIPAVRESLKSKIELALIDEFQDTSPIQLALFTKLAELANRSIWVGDIKQAIYGFRGTDPQLMQLAARTFDHRPPLTTGYRSRPALISISNETFKRVFPASGIRPENVVIRAHRQDAEPHEPAVELWRCCGKNLEFCANSLAAGLVQLLSRSAPFRVGDSDKDSRPVRGSDIAILCRSNDRCNTVASALSAAGLKVAISRGGLLDTPECLLAYAAFRYLVDRQDTLALAQITHLNHDYSDPNEVLWLQPWLENSQAEVPSYPHIEAFDNMRIMLQTCTVPEVLQIALNCADVTKTIAKWGRVRQRMSNLDALFGIIEKYETSCELSRSATTPAGFISYLDNSEEPQQPPSSDPEAINVLTYHKAKGLEWPVVVLSDLDKESAPTVSKDVCGVSIEPSNEPFNLKDPLSGRWIRFWPWPYGSQRNNVHLDVAALESPEFKRTAQRLLDENVRLMYVGMTRARDLLIFAPYFRSPKKSGMEWLNELKEDSNPVLQFPEMDTGITHLRIGDSEHLIRIQTLEAAHTAEPIESPATFAAERGERTEYAPYLITPSKAGILAPTEKALTFPILDIGERIPITGAVDMALLGDCVHSFLAADAPEAEYEWRLNLAKRIRTQWSISQISAESLLTMSDKLDKFLKSQFCDAHNHRECPITATVDGQRVHGRLDLLVETSTELFIFDHKTFPGPPDKWIEKAASFIPQLRCYADCLRTASPKKTGGTFIHMPIIGKVIDISAQTL